MKTVAKITYGYLIPHLLENRAPTVDEVKSFEVELTRVLTDRFPDATLEILKENAQGSLPHNLRTIVVLDNGEEDEQLAFLVNELAENAWSNWLTSL